MLTEPKRFYREVTVAGGDGAYEVLLDRRPVRTPEGRPLRLPKAPLAEAIAAEWRAQADLIRLPQMPLMRLVATAFDRVAGDRGAVIDHVIAYAASDLLCYRADEPEDLRRRQENAWQPLVTWATERWDVRFEIASGVMPVGQPAATIAGLGDVVRRLNDLQLTALASVVQASGSLIIGLALVEGRLTAAEAFSLAALDEHYQAERWGADDEADRRRQAVADDMAAAERLLLLLGGAA
jgi:chaperone required for assembly of F1-ATPase